MLFNYASLLNVKLSLFTFLFLGLSIFSLWIKRRFIFWGSLLLVAILFGFAAHRLQWISLFFMAFYGGIVYSTFRISNLKIRILCGFLVTLVSIMLWFHQIPGFSNWLIAKDLIISPTAIPYTMYLNFDKPLIGLFILGFGTLPLLYKRTTWLHILKDVLPIALVGTSIIFWLAYRIGYIDYELKFNQFFIIWAINNLIFSCISEKVLCRGFIQYYLCQFLKKFRFGDYISILLASLLFGLLHVGDLKYIMLTSAAGLLYPLHFKMRTMANVKRGNYQ